MNVKATTSQAIRNVGGGGPRKGVYASIDLGSSSGKQLVMQKNANGTWKTVLDEKIGCALGKDVKNGASIPAENQERALAALRTFIEHARERGVDVRDIPVTMTAVVRNANNGAAFLEKVKALGLTQARTLSGEAEAEAGFLGALLMCKGQPGEYATLDLGGGSFQLAIGDEEGMDAGGSTQVGSNVVVDEWITPRLSVQGTGDADAIFADVDLFLKKNAPMPIAKEHLRGRTLVATGGISKFLRTHFKSDVISVADMEALRRRVLAMPYDARVAFVQTGKSQEAKVALGIETPKGARDYGMKLPASTSLLLHILRSIGADQVRVSETDVRHLWIDRASHGA